jgi:hypothetical protein
MTPARRTKLTKEQGFALIEAFQKSGLKPTPFCTQQNIHYCVFRYWFSKTRKQSFIKKNEACFLPIKVNPPASVFSQTALKVSLNSSVAVEIPPGFDMRAFKQILEVCHDVANR